MYRAPLNYNYNLARTNARRKVNDFRADERYTLLVGKKVIMHLGMLEDALAIARPLVILWKQTPDLPHVKIIDKLTGERTVLIH